MTQLYEILMQMGIIKISKHWFPVQLHILQTFYFRLPKGLTVADNTFSIPMQTFNVFNSCSKNSVS